jgi:hypothetical protein
MLFNTELLCSVAVAAATSGSANTPQPFSLPLSNTSSRPAEIEKTRQGFTYGTDDTIVGANPWPSGPLGRKAIQAQYDAFLAARVLISRFVEQDNVTLEASLNDVSDKQAFGNDHGPC